MKKPTISVIMPVYNAEKFLDESIQSIINQTFRDFEFIIINDSSKDNSLKIIKSHNDYRIKLINNKKNLGLQKSLNKGLKIAKGKYITRMDADDISLPNRFRIQLNFLEKNPSIFLIGSSVVVIDEKENKIGIFRKYDNFKKLKKKLLRSNTIIHPSIMFRNTRKIFYREKFKSSEDYDLYLRILSSGKRITNLPNFLLKYRISKYSFVSTMPNQEFFFQKAKEFYWQRIKKGVDDYENLIPPLREQKNSNFDKVNLYTKILVEFQDNQMKKVRKDIKKFFKEFGINRILIIYYVLSFVPIRLTWFIKSKIL